LRLSDPLTVHLQWFKEVMIPAGRPNVGPLLVCESSLDEGDEKEYAL
jgi:hypothetical protein